MVVCTKNLYFLESQDFQLSQSCIYILHIGGSLILNLNKYYKCMFYRHQFRERRSLTKQRRCERGSKGKTPLRQKSPPDIETIFE